VGNFSDEPQLICDSHLSASSPCRSAGSSEYAAGRDIDGEPWADPPSVGCDEFHSRNDDIGPLAVAIQASLTNVVPGFEIDFTAQISGCSSGTRWEFGDGTVLSNRLTPKHAWHAAGNYSVVMRAFNQTYPAGVSATVSVHVVPISEAVHYVAADSGNPVAPYNSWATAAQSIQDAVDAAISGGLVLVTNGVHQTGGRAVHGTMTNRVAVTKPVTVRSINGPAVTLIVGYQVPGMRNGDGAIRCAYLTNGAALVGFTLTNGATRIVTEFEGELATVGGGVRCESASAMLSNCVLTGNAAHYDGGGAYGGTLNNCTFSGNLAGAGGGASHTSLNNCVLVENSASVGGGAFYATLNQCMLVSNTAAYGGGAAFCSLNNCMLVSNTAARGGGGDTGSSLNNCTLAGNSAYDGGGALASVLTGCLVTSNSAGNAGGGVSGFVNVEFTTPSVLKNCTLTGNRARRGGGAFYGILSNCIIYYNTATNGTDNHDTSTFNTFNFSCTTPLPMGGSGNISDEPRFVDFAGGNLRLESNSPCINGGRDADSLVGSDLDNNPRIVGGAVDMGAYEFQSPASAISYPWLLQYGLPIGASTDAADPDGDGFNNWQEWRAGTNPTNAHSALRLLTPEANDFFSLLTWESVPGRTYSLEWTESLGGLPVFFPLATGIPAAPQGNLTSYYDFVEDPWPATRFYRVKVE
jgi:hypothetical protein